MTMTLSTRERRVGHALYLDEHGFWRESEYRYVTTDERCPNGSRERRKASYRRWLQAFSDCWGAENHTYGDEIRDLIAALRTSDYTRKAVGSWWLNAKGLDPIKVEALAVDTADRQRADEWWPMYEQDCAAVGRPVDGGGREHLSFQSGFAAGCLDTRARASRAKGGDHK